MQAKNKINVFIFVFSYVLIFLVVLAQKTMADDDPQKFNIFWNAKDKLKTAQEFSVSEKDANKAAVWKYLAAEYEQYPRKEEVLNQLLSEYPDAVFPNEQFLSSVPKRYLEIFMVAGQKILPAIYFEIAEINYNKLGNSGRNTKPDSIKKKESYEKYFSKSEKIYEKITGMTLAEFGDDPKAGRRFRTMAYAYLLDLYESNWKSHQAQICGLSDEILSSDLDEEFTITKWGKNGYLKPETLLAKAWFCEMPVEKRNDLLVRVLKDYSEAGWGVHGGTGGSYEDSALYIGFHGVNNGSFMERILAEKNIGIKCKYEVYVKKGDAFLKAGDRLKAQKQYLKASSCLERYLKTSSYIETNSDAYGWVRAGARGDFEWFDENGAVPSVYFERSGDHSCIGSFFEPVEQYSDKNNSLK